MTENPLPYRARRVRDPERSRRAILDAAREVFVAHGFTGARTGEIAKRAGVPQGLVFHYFENKESLFDAVMEDALTPYFSGMLEMLQSAARPDLPLLENSVRRYYEFLRDHPHVTRLLAWWIADQAQQGDKPLTKKRGIAEAVELLGAQRIREGQEAGFIRADLEPGFVIKTFIDLCMMWHMSKGHPMHHCLPEGMDPAAADVAYLEHMISVYLDGITPRDTR
jgi:AcrR family transcriptional regulator